MQSNLFKFWNVSILMIMIIIMVVGCKDPMQIEQSESGNAIQYAKNIKIFSTSIGHKVEIINPDTKKLYKYLITSNGNHSLKGYQTIATPTKGITVLSATHVGMLSKIDAIENIKGFSNINYVYNALLKKQIQSGYTTIFGEEQSVSPEAIIKSKSKLMIYTVTLLNQ
jgi:hypothetical protein